MCLLARAHAHMYDFWDLRRTAVPGCEEDEEELQRVELRMDMFRCTLVTVGFGVILSFVTTTITTIIFTSTLRALARGFMQVLST